jgi:Fe-S-cluster containining protein
MTTEEQHTAAAEIERHAACALDRSRDAAACASIARRTVAAIETEFAAQAAAGAAIACAPGCAFCCHLRVGAYPHEGIALLDHLRTRIAPEIARAIEARIVANARDIDGLTVRQHYAARMPCAFLVDGLCAAHDARPSACARYHSMSRARCAHAFEHPADMGTPSNSRPVLAALQDWSAAAEAAVESALARSGLSAAKSELHQLLRALIEDPGAADRWRAGAPVAAPSTPS